MMNKWKLVWPLLAVVCLASMLCACGINPVATVEGLIPIVGVLLAIAGTVGETLLPAEASLIQTAVSLVTNGLNALLSSLQTYDANKSAPGAMNTLQAAFNAVHVNLQQLLAAAKVTNPLTTQKISGVVNGVIATLATIEAYLVAKHPAAPASTDQAAS